MMWMAEEAKAKCLDLGCRVRDQRNYYLSSKFTQEREIPPRWCAMNTHEIQQPGSVLS